MPIVLGAETLTGEEHAKSGSIYQGFACSPPGRNGGNIEGNIRVIENLSEQASEVMTGELFWSTSTSTEGMVKCYRMELYSWVQ